MGQQVAVLSELSANKKFKIWPNNFRVAVQSAKRYAELDGQEP
jgi:hypothetical protein